MSQTAKMARRMATKKSKITLMVLSMHQTRAKNRTKKAQPNLSQLVQMMSNYSSQHCKKMLLMITVLVFWTLCEQKMIIWLKTIHSA